MKAYYFPIQATSLAHYFGSAIIKPAKYFNNKPHDIQDNYKDFLLFTNKIGTTETDCCLEVVLTDEEAKDLIDVKGGWYLFDVTPLPISRVRKVFFCDKEKKDTIVTNIRMSTAYLPESLIELRMFDNNQSELIEMPTDYVAVEQNENINKFDRFLGALALMKTAGEPYMNYSQNYIATLAFFNSVIREQVGRCTNQCFIENYQGIFDNSKGFEQVLPYLDKPIDEQVLNEIAEKNKQEIKKDKITRIIDIDAILDTWTYTIAVLNTFGVGNESRRKKIDGLIQSHFSEIRKGKAEGVALCYGYNRGYSAFTKDYGIEKVVPLKYKLQSRLDYYTIESVYQFVFNGVVSSDFPYLDNWCPQLPFEEKKRKTDYRILDEIIIGKKKAKVFSQEWLDGLFPRFVKKYSEFAKPLFQFFQEISKEMKEDLEDEQEEEKKEFEREISANIKQINELKFLLEQKTLENSELQKQIIEFSKFSSVSYRTDESSIQTIASEPEADYVINTGVCFNESELSSKNKEQLVQIAKQRGIKIPSKAKKDEIIRLLLLTINADNNDLFSSSSIV